MDMHCPNCNYVNVFIEEIIGNLYTIYERFNCTVCNTTLFEYDDYGSYDPYEYLSRLQHLADQSPFWNELDPLTENASLSTYLWNWKKQSKDLIVSWYSHKYSYAHESIIKYTDSRSLI